MGAEGLLLGRANRVVVMGVVCRNSGVNVLIWVYVLVGSWG